ncbi:MAG: substrate-binding domain-containing protein [Bacillota bacterium]|nr:substrate-binding domain-containing protein [Bacillota bacterium]
MKLKRLRLYLIIISIISIIFTGCSGNNVTNNDKANSSLIGNSDEEYYMVTFLSGMEYWKGCYKGFQDAGKLYGIKTIFTGGIQYDVNQEVTALEQIIAKKPAGIAISCMNPDALKAPIKKAMEAGIPVVTFDSDSPDSGRYSFLGTGNEYAGEVAAKALSEQLGADGGEVVIITNPAQLNNEQRVEGFKNAIKEQYGNLKIVQIGNGNSDQTEAAKVLSGCLQTFPNIKGVFCTEATSGVGAAAAVKEANKVGKIKIVSFDTDKGTLDAIKSGVISASIAQGTYVMGFQSMNFLYQLKHELINPVNDWKSKDINPLPPFVDTGVNIITASNVKSFYNN